MSGVYGFINEYYAVTIDNSIRFTMDYCLLIVSHNRAIINETRLIVLIVFDESF